IRIAVAQHLPLRDTERAKSVRQFLDQLRRIECGGDNDRWLVGRRIRRTLVDVVDERVRPKLRFESGPGIGEQLHPIAAVSLPAPPVRVSIVSRKLNPLIERHMRSRFPLKLAMQLRDRVFVPAGRFIGFAKEPQSTSISMNWARS